MASDRDIKLRIRSVGNIGKITRAMKMVAAARLRKVETQTRASRPYARKLQDVVAEMSGAAEETGHPLLQVSPVQKVGVVVIGADKGLCGSYNSNIFRLAYSRLGSLPGGGPARVVLVGTKTRRFFQRRDLQPDRVFTGWDPDLALARDLADLLSGWFVGGEVDEIRCFYTRAVSAMTQEPSEERILPLAEPEGRSGRQASLLFEPGAQQALNQILPAYLRIRLHQVLLESRTSELGARLRAMTNATENADKLASELTLEFYRIRQENITTEILEISSGAEALKG